MDASLNLEGGIHFVFAWILLFIVIIDVIGNGFGEGFKGRIIFLKLIEHFIFQPTKEGFHNAVVIAVAFSEHELNDSIFLKLVPIKCVLVLPALI